MANLLEVGDVIGSDRTARNVRSGRHRHSSSQVFDMQQFDKRGVAKNPGKPVILSAAENLRDSSEILRCAQNDKKIAAPAGEPPIQGVLSL
jgi:hypothetical protein